MPTCGSTTSARSNRTWRCCTEARCWARYDDVAEAYERFQSSNGYAWLARDLITALNLAPGASLLDVGCGTGAAIMPAQRLVGSHGVVVADHACRRRRVRWHSACLLCASLIAMKRAGLDASEIGCVLLTHLHGDHFGGLPFLILDGQFARRTRPLVVGGPPGVRERVEVAMEVFFPGSSKVDRRFAVESVELREGLPTLVGPATVTPFVVQHASGAPAYALRVEYGGKVITYSGDTEWTETLVDAARGADLFVCEAYFFDKKIKYHLDYQTLRENRQRLDCRRVVLTHMSVDMLSRRSEADMDCADDGQVILL